MADLVAADLLIAAALAVRGDRLGGLLAQPVALSAELVGAPHGVRRDLEVTVGAAVEFWAAGPGVTFWAAGASQAEWAAGASSEYWSADDSEPGWVAGEDEG
jgi:hypothetical protein